MLKIKLLRHIHTFQLEMREVDGFELIRVNTRPNNMEVTPKGADLAESITEHSRPLFTPQDVLQLPKDEQIVLIQGMKPFKCKKLPYAHVDTWWRLLNDNPIEGGKLPLKRRFSISYKDVRS